MTGIHLHLRNDVQPSRLHPLAHSSPHLPLVLAAATVGVLDLLDAFLFFGARGVAPVRILHSIAAGILGRDAYVGGVATAALGFALHFMIATGIVLVYHAGSRFLPRLRTRVLLVGAAYGMLVYAVMNFVIVPLSAAPHGPKPLAVIVNGLIIHVFGVGVPTAWFVHQIRRNRMAESAAPAAVRAD